MGVSAQEYINRYGRSSTSASSVGGASPIAASAASTAGLPLQVKLEGFEELAAKLRSLVPAMRRRILGNALRAGARVVRDEARGHAPVLAVGSRAKYRTPGLVRSRISVRTSKVARRDGNVGVFVNVKPAEGAKYTTVRSNLFGLKGLGTKTRVKVRTSQRGANSPRDPFYWRFLEFGTRKMRARSFLRPAARALPRALQVFQGAVGKWFAKVEQTGRVAP